MEREEVTIGASQEMKKPGEQSPGFVLSTGQEPALYRPG